MKRLALILLIGLTVLSCTKEDGVEPIQNEGNKTVTPTPNPTPTPNGNVYDFNGVWSCDNWIVDEFTGATRKRSFIFSNQTTYSCNISLNQYILNGTFTQIFTNSSADIDSNYFDNHSNTIPVKFKGVLTTDSTSMVYEYNVDGFGTLDTTQIQEFKRD